MSGQAGAWAGPAELRPPSSWPATTWATAPNLDPWRRLLEPSWRRPGPHGRRRRVFALAGSLGLAPRGRPALGTAHVGAARGPIAEGRRTRPRTQRGGRAKAPGPLAGLAGGGAVAVQRRLGLGPTPSGPDALTPRGRSPCLLAEGLSNSQLAERLHLPPHGRGPRLQHPLQAGQSVPHRGRGLGCPRRPGASRLTGREGSAGGVRRHRGRGPAVIGLAPGATAGWARAGVGRCAVGGALLDPARAGRWPPSGRGGAG